MNIFKDVQEEFACVITILHRIHDVVYMNMCYFLKIVCKDTHNSERSLACVVLQKRLKKSREMTTR